MTRLIQKVKTTLQRKIFKSLNLKRSLIRNRIHRSRSIATEHRCNKQQLNFWINIIFLNNNHRHPLKGLLDQGLLMNLSYLKYSQKLETTYQTPKTCNIVLSEEFCAVNRMKIATKANNDPYPRPVVYICR